MSKNRFCIDVLAPSELADHDVAAWRQFNVSTEGLSVAFLTHAYARIAEHSFSHVRVARIRQDGETVAFFPFQFKSSAYRLLGIGERLTGELSDYFGIVGRAGFSIET